MTRIFVIHNKLELLHVLLTASSTTHFGVITPKTGDFHSFHNPYDDDELQEILVIQFLSQVQFASAHIEPTLETQTSRTCLSPTFLRFT